MQKILAEHFPIFQRTLLTTGNCATKQRAFSEKTSYNFLLRCLINTFSKQQNITVLIPEYLLFLIGLFSVIGTLKSSYKFVRIFPLFYRTFSFFYRTFSTQKKQKFLFPFIDPFLLLPSSLYNTFLPSFFYLSLTTCVKGEIIQTFIIMHNYETILVIILVNLNIGVVKLKKSENNSAPSWVRTRTLVVRRLERRPLTCEIIPTALRLLVT